MPDDIVAEFVRLVGDVRAGVQRKRIGERALGEIDSALWDALGQVGAVTRDDDADASLDDLRVGIELCRALAAEAVPFGEHAVLAGWLLGRAGMSLPSTPTTSTVSGDLVLEPSGEDFYVSGRLTRVPWARHCETVVVLVAGNDGRERIAALPVADAGLLQETNMAAEPRDTLIFDRLKVSGTQVVDLGTHRARALYEARSQLVRAAQMSGAIRRVVDLTYRYATTRTQFGRELSSMPVIQQYLARLTAQAELAGAALSLSVRILEQDGDPRLITNIAKVVVNEAAGEVARLAHQVHGAIGFTSEYELGQFTTRLWSWRDECSNEFAAAEVVGRQALGASPHGDVWHAVTEVSLR